MAIKADHRALRGAPGDAGTPPDADPWVGRALAQAWIAANDERHSTHSVPGTRFRFSMAGGCTRSLAYYVAGEPESDPPDAASIWRMGLGTMIHDQVQDVVMKAFPGADIEVTVHAPEIDGSGHADIVVRTVEYGGWADDNGTPIEKPKTVVVELKSMNGFGFKMAATHFKGAPQGPRHDHVVQAALAGYELDADEIIVAYLAMENVSPDLAKYCDDPVFGKFTAQWTFTRDEYRPIAEDEHRRIRYVYGQLDAGLTPAEVAAYIRIDDGTVVEINNPATGAWVERTDGQIVNAGKAWNCNYCRWQTTCATQAKG